MKFCVTYIYWILLLISITSSAVLFLIVASEGLNEKESHFEKDEGHKHVSNSSFAETKEKIQKESDSSISDVKVSVPSNIGRGVEDSHKETEHINDDTQMKVERMKKAEEFEVVSESSTQQPNFSQGISETGQAVVLTLVDTAASELQSLVDPKTIPEFRARSLTNNLSLTSTTINGLEETLETLTDQELKFVISSDRINESADSDIPVMVDVEQDSEAVVVVRAEKKSGFDEIKSEVKSKTDEDDLFKGDDKIKEEELNSASAFNESDASAESRRNNNESAVPIIDGVAVSGSPDTHEDMPSFSEWAQKRLEEAEKKKTHPNVSVQNTGSTGKNAGGMKVRSKNYASPDCGAKIVAANPESRGSRNVLVSTRDEYMLNTCTSRIWFVVELCEAIQAKKIELANFELFSSSPREFSVYVSDRWPIRDWSSVGHFTAIDERDIQSFTLLPHLFGKFIKIELHSHYGAEHFCPISLFRAYGTSEFEVLETETDVQVSNSDDEDNENVNDNGEEALDFESGESTRNLFGSAKDAVLSIVRKAAEVLVKTGDLSKNNNITKIQESIREDLLQSSLISCITPRYAIVCRNCTDNRFARVFQLLSCRERYLNSLLHSSFIRDTLKNSHLCWSQKGKSKEDSSEFEMCRAKDPKDIFLTSVLTPDYVVALCNILTAEDGNVLLNSSDELAPVVENITSKRELTESVEEKKDNPSESSQSKELNNLCSLELSSSGECKPAVIVKEQPGHQIDAMQKDTETLRATTSESLSVSEPRASQIKSARTATGEEIKREVLESDIEPSKDKIEELGPSEILTTPLPVIGGLVKSIVSDQGENPQGEDPGKVESLIQPSSISGSEQDKREVHEKDDVKPQEISEGSSVESKVESQEQERVELGEDVKILSQEQMNFDSLLSDFKEFEGEALQNEQANSVAQPMASSTPLQKESVFLRLSNRIKTLERNMSLSGQYLEELSRRYKKQVEEMQRTLERATMAMNEESRKREERDSKRLEEISVLRDEVMTLSKSLENLLFDQDSWQSTFFNFAQHSVVFFINIVLLIIIISNRRRVNDFVEEAKRIHQPSQRNRKVSRRKTSEVLSNKILVSKKSKERRPSEIASNISGTYEKLMIKDRKMTGLSRRERKKKRKKEMSQNELVRYKELVNVLPNPLQSGKASSIGTPNSSNDSLSSNIRRPDSAPENYAGWIKGNSDQRIEILSAQEIEGIQVGFSISSETQQSEKMISPHVREEKSETFKEGLKSGILNTKISSPAFMKTALGSRSKRMSITSIGNRKSDGRSSDQQSNSSLQIITEGQLNELNRLTTTTTTNGHKEESDRSSMGTPTSMKKEKKSTGLKKMVKKLF